MYPNHGNVSLCRRYSMTDTPETDKLRDDIWKKPEVGGSDFAQMFRHARKLERARDEASESLEFQRKLNVELNERAKCDLQNITEQRDRLAEALKEIYNVSSFKYDTMPELARKKYREVVLEMADNALQCLTNNPF
jgi:hypothetical protein